MDIFHIWFDVQIVIFVWKDEKNEKETEDGQFKKLLVTVFELQVYGKQNNNSCQLYNERQMSRYLDTYFNKLWRNQKIFTIFFRITSDCHSKLQCSKLEAFCKLHLLQCLSKV